MRKAEERERLRREVETLRSSLGAGAVGRSVVAESQAMRDLLELASRVARHNTTVLITGESGTGKEVMARAIHRMSPRGERSFTAINCAAIPEQLLESELFGHVKGAFTGATADRAGLFELAHGGTLLLDEIGDLPLDLQAKLLRVLEEGEIRRVGGRESRKVDVRVIAATGQPLEQAVERGEFRADLLLPAQRGAAAHPAAARAARGHPGAAGPLRRPGGPAAGPSGERHPGRAGALTPPSLARQRARAPERGRARRGAGHRGPLEPRDLRSA